MTIVDEIEKRARLQKRGTQPTGFVLMHPDDFRRLLAIAKAVEAEERLGRVHRATRPIEKRRRASEAHLDALHCAWAVSDALGDSDLAALDAALGLEG